MKRIYYKLISCFLRIKAKANYMKFADFEVNFARKDVLELPKPKIHKQNPSYVFIKSLKFSPEIKINKMQDFKSLLKWKTLSLNYPVVFRDYPLGWYAKIKKFDHPDLALKLPPNVLEISRSEFYIPKHLKTNEEIVRILPYVRKKGRKVVARVPVVKSPLYKASFSKEEMKLIREKVAQQNNTGWLNIMIFEIYDKFYSNCYANVRQVSKSKELECSFSAIAAEYTPKKNYYLVIGQMRDSGQPVKAIIDSADIKLEDSC